MRNDTKTSWTGQVGLRDGMGSIGRSRWLRCPLGSLQLIMLSRTNIHLDTYVLLINKLIQIHSYIYSVILPNLDTKIKRKNMIQYDVWWRYFPLGETGLKEPNGLMDLGPWFSKPSDLVHVFICFPCFSELPTVDDPVTVGDTPRRSLSSIWEAYLFAGAVDMMPL